MYLMSYVDEKGDRVYTLKVGVHVAEEETGVTAGCTGPPHAAPGPLLLGVRLALLWQGSRFMLEADAACMRRGQRRAGRRRHQMGGGGEH